MSFRQSVRLLSTRRQHTGGGGGGGGGAAVAKETLKEKVKRLATEQGKAFGMVYIAVNALVVGSIYVAVAAGFDTVAIDATEAGAKRLGYELDLKERLAASGTAAKESSRWAMTLALYSVAPIAPITFPAYIAGTVALSRWAPFARHFGTAATKSTKL